MIKNLSYFIALFFSLFFVKAQQWTTGEITLSENYNVTFVSNVNTGVVTMTMVGPSDVWLAVAPGSYGMADEGNDIILYHSEGLADMKLSGGYSEPIFDEEQDWTLVSDNVIEGTRTLIATRKIDTENSDDFVFPTSSAPFPIIWAMGSDLSLSYHQGMGSGKNQLGDTEISMTKMEVSFYPNSTENILNIHTEKELELFVKVFNLNGEEVMKEVRLENGKLDVTNIEAGVYVAEVFNNDNFNEKFTFIKK